MLKWFPTLLSVLTLVVTALSTQVQAFWSHHGALAGILIGVWGVASHLLPSPVAK
jgi:hypothetical protein